MCLHQLPVILCTFEVMSVCCLRLCYIFVWVYVSNKLLINCNDRMPALADLKYLKKMNNQLMHFWLKWSNFTWESLFKPCSTINVTACKYISIFVCNNYCFLHLSLSFMFFLLTYVQQLSVCPCSHELARNIH